VGVGGKVEGRGGETAAMRCGVEKARGSMTRGGEGAPRPREWRRKGRRASGEWGSGWEMMGMAERPKNPCALKPLLHSPKLEP
jgi:hypothetical protein